MLMQITMIMIPVFRNYFGDINENENRCKPYHKLQLVQNVKEDQNMSTNGNVPLFGTALNPLLQTHIICVL